jgi:hypothetical protein
MKVIPERAWWRLLQKRTWWRLFQKRVVCIKFDIYVFITFEKCNVSDRIRLLDLSYCKPPLYQLSKRRSPAVSRDSYEPTTVHITLRRGVSVTGMTRVCIFIV